MERVENQNTEVQVEILEECRICQENDFKEKLDTPCSCIGTMKYAHRSCIQMWCYEKRNTTCEICKQPFSPGYFVEPPSTLKERIRVTIARALRDDRAEPLLDHDDNGDLNWCGLSNRGTIICGGLYLLFLGIELTILHYLNLKMANSNH